MQDKIGAGLQAALFVQAQTLKWALEKQDGGISIIEGRDGLDDGRFRPDISTGAQAIPTPDYKMQKESISNTRRWKQLPQALWDTALRKSFIPVRLTKRLCLPWESDSQTTSKPLNLEPQV